MSGTGKRIYPLLFGLLAFAWQAWGLEPIDHRPIPELAAALKNSGYERIAQGYQLVVAPGAEIGDWTTEKVLFILSTNKQTGEWAISVVHDNSVGSTLLIGKNLQRVPGEQREDGYRALFRGEIVFTANSALEMADAYYQQEVDNNMLTLEVKGKPITIAQGKLRGIMIKRVQDLKEQRAELIRKGGDRNEIAQLDALMKQYGEKAAEQETRAYPHFRGMKPVSAEVQVSSDGGFRVVATDQNAKRANIAFGDTFSEKP